MSLLCLIFQMLFYNEEVVLKVPFIKSDLLCLLSLIYKFPIMFANMQTNFTSWIKLLKISSTENIHFKIQSNHLELSYGIKGLLNVSISF